MYIYVNEEYEEVWFFDNLVQGMLCATGGFHKKWYTIQNAAQATKILKEVVQIPLYHDEWFWDIVEAVNDDKDDTIVLEFSDKKVVSYCTGNSKKEVQTEIINIAENKGCYGYFIEDTILEQKDTDWAKKHIGTLQTLFPTYTIMIDGFSHVA